MRSLTNRVRVRESNPGHIGGRLAWEANAQPLRHPCSPHLSLVYCRPAGIFWSVTLSRWRTVYGTVFPHWFDVPPTLMAVGCRRARSDGGQHSLAAWNLHCSGRCRGGSWRGEMKREVTAFSVLYLTIKASLRWSSVRHWSS